MEETAQKLLALKKGILALDWSPKTISKQFEMVGLTSTPELNREYRQMLVTSPNLENFISGVILHDETVNQNLDGGESFVNYLSQKEILVGVRADNGSQKYKDTDQNMASGLEGLDERLRSYASLGIKFSKWRAGFKISDLYPSKEFIEESVKALAEFARLSHKNNLVPLVEPDVEMKGNHTTTRCEETTTDVLRALFAALKAANLNLSNIILKTNMVLPGVDSGVVAESLEVANATLRTLRNSVPDDVAGIVFLSGGQSFEASVMHLDKIEDLSKDDPWKISFSYARSLQTDALKQWRGKNENIESAQKVLAERLEKASKARMGEL